MLQSLVVPVYASRLVLVILLDNSGWTYVVRFGIVWSTRPLCSDLLGTILAIWYHRSKIFPWLFERFGVACILFRHVVYTFGQIVLCDSHVGRVWSSPPLQTTWVPVSSNICGRPCTSTRVFILRMKGFWSVFPSVWPSPPYENHVPRPLLPPWYRLLFQSVRTPFWRRC